MEKEKQDISIVIPNLKSATTTSGTLLSAGSVSESSASPIADDGASDVIHTKRLIRKLRIQVNSFFFSLCISAMLFYIRFWG